MIIVMSMGATDQEANDVRDQLRHYGLTPHDNYGTQRVVIADGSLPPSLRNILAELREDCGYEMPSGGSLKPWAKHGILLLNTVLTVRGGERNSHAGHGLE